MDLDERRQELAEAMISFMNSMRTGEPIPVNDITLKVFLSLMKFAYKKSWAVSFYVNDPLDPDCEDPVKADHFVVSPPMKKPPDEKVVEAVREEMPELVTHLLVAADHETAVMLSQLTKEQAEGFAREKGRTVREVVVDHDLDTMQVWRDN